MAELRRDGAGESGLEGQVLFRSIPESVPAILAGYFGIAHYFPIPCTTIDLRFDLSFIFLMTKILKYVVHALFFILILNLEP